MAGARKVVAFNKATMDIVDVYNDAVECAEKNGIQVNSLHTILRNKSLMRGAVCFRYLDDFDVNESYEGKRYRPVVLTDTETGRRFCFYNASLASKALRVDPSSIYTSIVGGSKVLCRYTFDYYR